jgi:hypothetical protein
MDPNEPQAGERRQALSVDIQDFYADAGCAVTLRATWVLATPQIQGPKGDRGSGGAQASEETQVPGGGCSGPAAVPEAMSRALALLSDRIVAHIANAAPAARAP